MQQFSFLFLLIMALTINNQELYARSSRKNKAIVEITASEKNCKDLQKIFYKLQRSSDDNLMLEARVATKMNNDEIILCYKNYLETHNKV